jgi:hypothetical protein
VILRLTSMSLSSFVFCHFVLSSDLLEVVAPIPVFGEFKSRTILTIPEGNVGRFPTVSLGERLAVT